MSLTPHQVRDVARKTQEERDKAALAAAAPTPAQDKENRDLAHRLMRRRNLKQRGLGY